MHERSLVKSLLKQLDEVLDQHQSTLATGVHVEMGPLSGVDAECVRVAYEELSIGTRWSQAPLTIEHSDLVVRCRDCGSESRLVQFIFRCGDCGSGRVQVVSGDAFRLLSITVKEPAESSHA